MYPAALHDLVTIWSERATDDVCSVDDADVRALITIGVGDVVAASTGHANQTVYLNMEAGFFQGFAHGCINWAFSGLYRSADGAPALAIALFDHQDPAIRIGDQHGNARQQK